jgi:hypothetical protein
MKSIKVSAALLLFIAALCSFSGDVKPFNNADKWIPADFDTRKSTLLLQEFSIMDKPNANLKKAQDKINADMRTEMQADYHYKFEVVSKDDLKSAKYADTEKYRWVLIVQNTHTQSVGSGGASSSYSNVFHIYDRKADKHYPDTGHPSGSVIPTMKPTLATIMQFLKALK